uniref:Outer dynein arm-docking complex subunit 4 n=1 Tax=Sander lucioperca TaxID=283035 RepID=A0A8C9Y6K1_SANLU
MFDVAIHRLPKGVFSTLMADGDWLYTKGEYKKAIDSYTTALTLKPDDKTCFVGRAKCYLKMGQSDNALKDAEASLKEDKSFFEGLYQKAEALYYMGEFEFALVFYHRGQKLRPQIQEFRLGIQKAQEAIENSVGNPSFVKLEIKGDLSFLQKDEEKKQQTLKTPKSEKTTKQLLGEFYNLVKGKTKGGERLQDVIQGCLTYLDTCTEFWNQEKPISAQEKERKLMQQKPLPSTPSDPAHFLLKSLDDIDAGKAGSLKKAEDVMKIVQGWSEKEVPNKKEVLGSLHSCIGNAFIDLGDLGKALDHHQKDLEFAKQCKLPDAMSRALDNIGRVYAQIGQFSQAIEFWEKKIPLVRGGLEKTWLFHEIGWCYLELNRHEEARDCGVRSVAAADEIADEKCAVVIRALTLAQLQEDDSAMNVIQKIRDSRTTIYGHCLLFGCTSFCLKV